MAIFLLGGFRLTKDDRPVALRAGGKGEQLLGNLALRSREGIDRDELLGLVWPATDESLALQSLNSLTHALRRNLADALDGAAPVVRRDGRLRLNVEQGIAVDIAEFDDHAASGDRLDRLGRPAEAIPCYEKAVELYAGDLALGSEIRHLLERERLRARYLSLLAHLAGHSFAIEDYESAEATALELLTNDPCREDAHRMVMRSSVRLGRRAQALRQYQLCAAILRREFGAEPEPATNELYEQIRLAPGAI